jgi:Skp family chaperone for outer membrane proteins
MQKTFFLIIFTFFFTLVQSQEKTELKLNNQIFKAGIGVVDMKKILAQSTAYQALVDDFEEKRRKHRNLLQNKRMLLEMRKVNF